MVPQATSLVRKLWQYCNVLRDDGLSYPDYVEQLTYLLFLKMADEQQGEVVPKEFAWSSFAGKDAESLHRHYSRALKQLSRKDGMLGLIFSEARNKIRDPAKLRTLVAEQFAGESISADAGREALTPIIEDCVTSERQESLGLNG